MRVNPISNITRTVLPLAATAVIGLGSLASCSSSKNEKQEPTYVQTEMMKLDNTLDSLKSVRGEGNKAFLDYYDKSKSTINEAQLDSSKLKGHHWGLILGALGFGLLGAFGGAMIATSEMSKEKRAKYFTLGAAPIMLMGLATAFVTKAVDFANTLSNINSIEAFSEYKEQKIADLESEKTLYLNDTTKGIKR